MDNLNAPLGMDNRQGSKPSKSPKQKTAKIPAIAGLLFLSVLGVNAYTFISAERDDETAIVRLPEPEPVEVAAKEPEQETVEEPQVEVIYGDPNLSTQDVAPPPLPVPEPREQVKQVSPGGPRIITVRDPMAIQIGQSNDRAHLPVSEALEESPHGKLPKLTANGRRPLDIYARPWSRGGGKRIAIIIGGIGLSQTGTSRALEQLPPEITLGIAPTGNSLNRWMRQARKKGHELLIQVPMEPFNYPQVNPGPNTLRLASSAETNIENLRWALGRTTNYTGVMNYLGGRFMGDQEAMQPILTELGQRGLLYFNDGSAGAAGNIGANSLRAQAPYLAGNIIIDSSRDAGSIRAKLKALESIATARGEAVGSGSALELTIKEVSQWANEAKKRGFEIVGAVALAKDPLRNR